MKHIWQYLWTKILLTSFFLSHSVPLSSYRLTLSACSSWSKWVFSPALFSSLFILLHLRFAFSYTPRLSSCSCPPHPNIWAWIRIQRQWVGLYTVTTLLCVLDIDFTLCVRSPKKNQYFSRLSRVCGGVMEPSLLMQHAGVLIQRLRSVTKWKCVFLFCL